MVNTDLLNDVITASGLKRGYIAGELDISETSLRNKITGLTEFKAGEIKTLGELLALQSDSITAIFFADNVAEKST